MPYSVGLVAYVSEKPVVIMEDDILHTAENNYLCNDPECPCRLVKAWNELQAYAWSHELELEIQED